MGNVRLIHFSPTPAPSTAYRPCQATCVQSHQRQPRSTVAIATCEVQVSTAVSQTVPNVTTGVSNPLCCRLTLTHLHWPMWIYCFVIYHSITTSVALQLCSPRCWHLDCNYCWTRCRQSQLMHIYIYIIVEKSPNSSHMYDHGFMDNDIYKMAASMT